jgi:N-acyl amino acid synthase of PEP-CTERM/exosortase system
MTEKTLAQHFHDYFSISIADTTDLKKAVYKLRYDVYCAELGYEKNCPVDSEKDSFDEYSSYVLIKHKASENYAGCVRLVTPSLNNPKAKIPFEVNCSQSVDPKKVAFLREEDGKVGEVSRLAVIAKFRLRASDAKTPDGINPERMSLEISKEEMRYFPFIAVALYFSATSVAVRQNLKYAVVMMAPALARLLNRSGINFIQLGETMNYHGQRALFYTDGAFIDTLKPELKELYQSIDQQLTHN